MAEDLLSNDRTPCVSGPAAPDDAIALAALAPRGFGPHASLGLVGRSPALASLGERIAAHARSNATVLIRGETGTGKELVARAVHALSLRRGGSFLPHNFAAISDTLIESELFGHARGAFTGAHADRPGLFELADGGTLFLDEIGDASASVQSRLLRVIQEGEVRRVGDGRARRVDVRIVAATHRDLAEEARAGRFRADLYYRLHVLVLEVPPLRERLEDVPLLAAHLLGAIARRDGIEVRGIARAALARLLAHDWPGNVRELEAVLTRAAHLAAADLVIRAEAFGSGIGGRRDALVRDRAATLRGRTMAYEAELIQSALERHGGNRTLAARSLGLTRQGLWKKMRRLRAAEDGDRAAGDGAPPADWP
ncbi:MAG TPA: sigma 54-interacting transcriptional regulator [Candidatus Eisenbacteria bacterium]